LQRRGLWGWKRVVFAVLADRLFDLWCILAALSFFLFLPPFSESSLKYLAYPCLLFFVGASLLYFGLPLIFGKKWGGESWKILCAWRFSTPTLVALSLWIWTLEALGLWCFLGALGLGSWYQAFSITFFYHLVIALPNTPGNIGVLELFYVYAFGLFQIPPEQALALSLVVQFSLFLLYVTLGMLVLFYEGWNFSDIKKLGKAGREQIQLDNYFSTC
jgi:uncharacterized membrane protein YbhN (UPF0104 family)